MDNNICLVFVVKDIPVLLEASKVIRNTSIPVSVWPLAQAVRAKCKCNCKKEMDMNKYIFKNQ